MKQFSKLMLIALSFGISAVALSLLPSKPVGAAGSAPVTVTNTPLPVQGTVAAAQSGTWNVGINGTPSVNVAGLPAVQFNGAQPVTVSNSENNPVFSRDVDNAVRQPFRQTLCATPQENCEFHVPLGKRLVIEYISGVCLQPVGTQVEAIFLLINGSDTFFFPMPGPPTFPGPGNSYHSYLSETTRIYADSGTAVGLGLTGSGGIGCSATISGYLVNE